MDNQSITHKMELYLSYCFYTEVQKKNNVWRKQKRSGWNYQEAVWDETGGSNWWAGMQRPHPYVCCNIVENECIGVYVIPEREKYTNAFWQAFGVPDKMGRQAFLTQGYYVSTVGNVNEETIFKYIQEQNDKLEHGRK